MPWWGWLSIGFLLMGAELFGVDAAFYLIFIGFAGILVGLVGLAGFDLAPWMQWVLFSAIAVVSMVLFRAKLYEMTRGGGPEYRDTLVGEVVLMMEDTPGGGRSRVSLRGSSWTVENTGESILEAGQSALVIETAGTILKVRKAGDNPAQREGQE